MTYIDRLEAEPWRFDYFSLMRRLERSLVAEAPRIGDSVVRRQEAFSDGTDEILFSVGQDPYLAFPASNLDRVEYRREGNVKRLRVMLRFLGMLGPQGALPLTTTEEAFNFLRSNDDAFSRFLDLFNQRFLLLFFRAWADSRAIVQNDRPEHDRFAAYVGASIGIGSPIFRGLDTVDDRGKAALAGLLGAQAKSASRLQSAIRELFKTEVYVEQFVGSWLAFEPTERSLLGSKNSGLGTDLLVGNAYYSVQDKIRIRLYVADMAAYERFLPNGSASRRLVDFVFFYVGDALDWDVELALPARETRPVQLGGGARLGWTSWVAPDRSDPHAYRCDARFHPAERVASERRAAA